MLNEDVDCSGVDLAVGGFNVDPVTVCSVNGYGQMFSDTSFTADDKSAKFSSSNIRSGVVMFTSRSSSASSVTPTPEYTNIMYTLLTKKRCLRKKTLTSRIPSS